MAVVSMKQFIEAGVHYGHQTRRWNPKMKPYIFGTKHGIHIIDLQKSLRMLKESFEFVRDLSAKGETVLFVGTKPQAREIVRDQAQRCSSFYINERWLGGLLTNFNTVKQSIGFLKKLEEQRGEEGLYEGFIKKEAMRMDKKRVKLDKALGGIKEMRKLPGAVFIIDCRKERIAVQEAQKLGVPIVAVVDTNCDPDNIDHVIPGNDDAIRSIELFTMVVANAVREGQAIYQAQLRTMEEEKPKPKRAPRATEKTEKADKPGKDERAKPAATEIPAAKGPGEASPDTAAEVAAPAGEAQPAEIPQAAAAMESPAAKAPEPPAGPAAAEIPDQAQATAAPTAEKPPAPPQDDAVKAAQETTTEQPAADAAAGAEQKPKPEKKPEKKEAKPDKKPAAKKAQTGDKEKDTEKAEAPKKAAAKKAAPAPKSAAKPKAKKKDAAAPAPEEAASAADAPEKEEPAEST